MNREKSPIIMYLSGLTIKTHLSNANIVKESLQIKGCLEYIAPEITPLPKIKIK